MRIDSVSIYHVRMPLVAPFNTAFGDHSHIESILTCMVCGDLEGWGEAAPWKHPAYSAEWADGVFCVLRDFMVPALVGKRIETAASLQTCLSWVKGNYFAKAALDLAWWDLHAKFSERPLFEVLRGTRTMVDVGADFGVMEDIDKLLHSIEDAIQSGYQRVKLKVRPGWEIEMIREVRKAFPGHVFHVDCNSAYSLRDFEMLEQLDEFGLAMIEQPLASDDLLDHSRLQRRLATPICLDESITSIDKARKAIELGACQWVNIKPGRVGGLTNAIAIHDLCQSARVPCWVGGMLESAIGASHCLALATLPNIKYPSDIFPSSRFYCTDLCEPSLELCCPSKIAVPKRWGVGAIPNARRLISQAVKSIKLP